jgi:hypothetical protein
MWYNSNMKQCSQCKRTEPRSMFSVNSRSNDGLDAWCKPCRKAYYESRRNLKNPKRLPGQCRRCWRTEITVNDHTYCQECKTAVGREARFKKFGISADQYVDLGRSQRWRCAICSTLDGDGGRKLCIDHDHSCCPGVGSCGKCIRGLICFKCNVALGMVKDSPDTLKKMLDYLT